MLWGPGVFRCCGVRFGGFHLFRSTTAAASQLQGTMDNAGVYIKDAPRWLVTRWLPLSKAHIRLI